MAHLATYDSMACAGSGKEKYDEATLDLLSDKYSHLWAATCLLTYRRTCSGIRSGVKHRHARVAAAVTHQYATICYQAKLLWLLQALARGGRAKN